MHSSLSNCMVDHFMKASHNWLHRWWNHKICHAGNVNERSWRGNRVKINFLGGNVKKHKFSNRMGWGCSKISWTASKPITPILCWLYKYYKLTLVGQPLDWSLYFIHSKFFAGKEKMKETEDMLKDIVNSAVVNLLIWVIIYMLLSAIEVTGIRALFIRRPHSYFF